MRGPEDYALIARRFAESLQRQNVLYAEVTLSIGVMIRRNQDPAANFAALRDAAAAVPGVKLKYILDAVRQWGAAPAMEVARMAAELRSPDIIAYGIGGDELGLPTADLRPVYDFVASQGMHRLIHAGEIGGPELVREAVEMLGAERIGHGIAVMRDERTMDFLAARNIPLEFCPTSNLRTGALARQIEPPDGRIRAAPAAVLLSPWTSRDPFQRRSGHVRNHRERRVSPCAADGTDPGGTRATRRGQLPSFFSAACGKSRDARKISHRRGGAGLGIMAAHESTRMGNAETHGPRSAGASDTACPFFPGV